MAKVDFSRLNLLLIEDENFTRVITRRTLAQIGVRNIAEAKDGESGLEEVKRARPDIIFCDINMAPMSGIEFLEKLRADTSDDIGATWVVMLTSESSAEVRMQAEKHLVAGYMVKPVSVNQMREQLESIVDQDIDLAARVNHGLPVDYGKLKVLVIDDEEVARKIVRQMLAQLGVKMVEEATDGMKGLMQVASFRPHMIFCDVNMSPMNGLKFLSGLRSLNLKGIEETPVIMLTGDSKIDTVREAQNLKVAGYLIKPTTTGDVRARVEHALRSAPRLYMQVRKT